MTLQECHVTWANLFLFGNPMTKIQGKSGRLGVRSRHLYISVTQCIWFPPLSFSLSPSLFLSLGCLLIINYCYLFVNIVSIAINSHVNFFNKFDLSPKIYLKRKQQGKQKNCNILFISVFFHWFFFSYILYYVNLTGDHEDVIFSWFFF